MKFKKYESFGNDFIVLEKEKLTNKTIISLCDRHKGVGGDGVLILTQIKNQSFRLTIFNADGSEASMCGNGLKIVGKYLKEKYPSKPFFWIKVKEKFYQVFANENEVMVKMPMPTKVEIDKYSAYQIGKLHMLVENVEEENIRLLASIYPNFNVSSYFIKSVNSVSFRTYEVGVGFTLSCGSASCCLFKLLIDQGYPYNELYVETRGGTFKLIRKDNSLYLTGNPRMVFKGEYCDEI